MLAATPAIPGTVGKPGRPARHGRDRPRRPGRYAAAWAFLMGALPLQARPARVLLRDVPHVTQKPDFCGEACLEMATTYLGHRISQDEVWSASGLPVDAGRGCHTADLYRAFGRLGIETTSPWIRLPADSTGRRRSLVAAWRDLQEHLARGRPVIVCTRFDGSPGASEHFRLLVGYDDATGRVVYHDPALERGAYRTMPVRTLLGLWPLSDGRGGTFLVRFVVGSVPDAPDPVRDPPPVVDPDRGTADLARRLGPGFHVRAMKPFLVAGDLSRETFDALCEGTIRWAHERLRRDFFDREPLDKVVTIYLFRDDASYRSHALELLGDRPSTPYGYYSPRHEALVMNIQTGGGTLVHEMVHPMLAVDFPGAPAWLNEGMGSLFEQCSEREGRIVGLLNWRLPGVQAAIQTGRLVPLRRLFATSEAAFYGDGTGLHYAQARYLLYWLQEQGLLRPYYRLFRATAAQDPTGIRQLEKILGDRRLESLEEEWVRFVRSLLA